jgi:hypothetical protein
MNRPEQDIHRAVIGHLKLRAMPGLVYWHAPMGMHAGSKVQGAIMKGLGARAGVCDLILVHRGNVYGLELKAEGGRVTEPQIEFMQDLDRAGGFTAVATGIDQALNTLEAWQLIRPAVTMKDVLRHAEASS